MDKKHNILLDKLIDNFIEIANDDKEFLNEIVKENKIKYRKRTESGINKISVLISEAKLELGRQRHFKTNRIFNLLSKLNEVNFIKAITAFSSNTSPQLALQFYRKLNSITDEESLKEDSLLIELIDNIDDIDSFETYINEQ